MTIQNSTTLTNNYTHINASPVHVASGQIIGTSSEWVPLIDRGWESMVTMKGYDAARWRILMELGAEQEHNSVPQNVKEKGSKGAKL